MDTPDTNISPFVKPVRTDEIKARPPIVGQCSACVYWFRNGSDLRQGVCRRYPPQAFPVQTPQGGTTVVVWPMTYNDMYCGEYCYRTG